MENTDLGYLQIRRIFNASQKIFFLGIGGVSVSALAEACAFLGKEVYGYDRTRSTLTKRLEKIAKITYKSDPDNVLAMDLLVYSGAVSESSFEIKRAKELKIPCISRANFLGFFMASYRERFLVCGTHGKSTTCAMLGSIFSESAKNPTIFCGAPLPGQEGTSSLGGNEIFIGEACEYQDAFLHFFPTQSIVTNIEYDHPDYFENEEAVLSSFQSFSDKNERIFLCANDRLCQKIRHPNKITFGVECPADYQAKNLVCSSKETTFSLLFRKEELGKITLPLPGKHNVFNATSACALALANGCDFASVQNALSRFHGIARRSEFVKKLKNGADLYVDYAHHPTEIRASLDLFSQMNYPNICFVFQSHTYSRSFALLDDFAKAFSGVKNLLCTPIYSAREQNTFAKTDEDFAKAVGGIYCETNEKVFHYLSCHDFDAVVLLGAGDIERLKNQL